MTTKMKSKIKILLAALAVFLVLLAVDLLTKAWAAKTEPHAYLFSGFGLTIVYNSGMAFSLFDDNKTMMIVIIAFTVLLMLAILVAILKIKPERKFLTIVLACIEAGAIGNLVDRVLWLSGEIPGVRDMVDVSFFGFGVCNFADFFVTFGGVALVIYFCFFSDDPLIRLKKKVPEGEKRGNEGEELSEEKELSEGEELNKERSEEHLKEPQEEWEE